MLNFVERSKMYWTGPDCSRPLKELPVPERSRTFDNVLEFSKPSRMFWNLPDGWRPMKELPVPERSAMF